MLSRNLAHNSAFYTPSAVELAAVRADPALAATRHRKLYDTLPDDHQRWLGHQPGLPGLGAEAEPR